MGATKSTEHFRIELLKWFQTEQRQLPWRDTDDPYRIWVSEVMLQQTQVATVVPYFKRFIERFPTIRALADAPEDVLLKYWEGLGYYARIRNLRAAARTVLTTYGGVIPRTPEAFRALKGVGDYIAAAVLSIAFDAPLPVVDGNVKRVIARLEREPYPINHSAAAAVFKPYAEKLLDRVHPGAFNQALMELGALVCTPRNPDCTICPVSDFCDARRHREVDAFPKRQRRSPVPTHRIAVGVIWRGDKVLITKRSPDGLLGGLWEFPGGKIAEGETAAAACLREIREETHLEVALRKPVTEVRHAYTHFKIVMTVFECVYLSGEVVLESAVAYRWVPLHALGEFAFPKANNKFIPLLEPP